MSIDKKKIILVEGKDDLNFTIRLLKYKNINDIMVEQYNGKDNLIHHINSLINRDGFDEITSLIIFRDSDDSSQSAIESINYCLKKTGLITENIKPFTINNYNNRKIGFGLFPGLDDNKNLYNTGSLEHLCLLLLKDNSNHEFVKSYLEDFQTKNAKFKKPQKNELHSVFSFTDKYVGQLIGQAAEYGGFDFNSPYLNPFIELINEM